MGTIATLGWEFLFGLEDEHKTHDADLITIWCAFPYKQNVSRSIKISRYAHMGNLIERFKSKCDDFDANDYVIQHDFRTLDIRVKCGIIQFAKFVFEMTVNTEY